MFAAQGKTDATDIQQGECARFGNKIAPGESFRTNIGNINEFWRFHWFFGFRVANFVEKQQIYANNMNKFCFICQPQTIEKNGKIGLRIILDLWPDP